MATLYVYIVNPDAEEYRHPIVILDQSVLGDVRSNLREQTSKV